MALRLSRDFKPDDPDELARLTALGGHVEPGKTQPFESDLNGPTRLPLLLTHGIASYHFRQGGALRTRSAV